MKITHITTRTQADDLYNTVALTGEGLAENDFEKAFDYVKTDRSEAFLILGEDMNRLYHLTGSNKYPADLHIFSVSEPNCLALKIGARGFSDIVDNNQYREEHN